MLRATTRRVYQTSAVKRGAEAHYSQTVCAGLALRGQAASATSKVEPLCIIDALDHGTLVFRNAKRQILLPPSCEFHWEKRWFEQAFNL